MIQAVAYTPDLIDRSKVAAVLPCARFVPRPEDLVGCGGDIVIVDLGRPGVLDILARVPATRLVGFASHVDRDTLTAARAAGCEAMPRSEFFRRLDDVATTAE